MNAVLSCSNQKKYTGMVLKPNFVKSNLKHIRGMIHRGILMMGVVYKLETKSKITCLEGMGDQNNLFVLRGGMER